MFTRITPAHGTSGGMEIHGQTLSRELVRRGYPVSIITTRHPEGIQAEEDNGVHIHYTDAPSGRYGRQWWRESVRRFDQLQKDVGFDVVWSQGAGGDAYARVPEATGRLPLVPIMHGTPGSRIRTAINQLLMGSGRPRSLALLVWLCGGYLGRRRAFVERANAVIAVSEELRDRVLHEYTIEPENVVVVPSGVDIRRFILSPSRREEMRHDLGLRPEQRVLLVTSRLVPEKGVHLAIRALARLAQPDVTLLVVGKGPYEAKLLQLVASSGVGRQVRFCGFVPNEKLPSYLNAADVCLMPTLCYEAFPMTIIEAMASGLPVVATDIGGIPTAIDDGINGLLFPVGSVEALAHQIERLLDNVGLTRSLGQTARAKAVERFSLEVMVQDTLSVFQEAIDAAGK
jgi:glycosyltransferase involved in cell wall biosynthesis